MNIQWYPGHMTKAKRMMQEDIKLIDLVIELVDARLPLSSRNPDIDELGKNKARLILLNKHDLADEKINDALEKIHEILGVLPEGYKEIDLSQLYVLRDKYPRIYTRVEERLESGWDATMELLQRGMKEGVIRRVDTALVKVMFEATLEQFFRRDVLVKNGISYSDALAQVVDIICNGIKL